MYFKESEHIANKEIFPRSDIVKIDKCLARRFFSQFKLQDVHDKCSVCENAAAILDEYIEFNVLKRRARYFCPEHKDEELKLRKSVVVTQRGHCHRCNKAYSLQGRETETIYHRMKTPDTWSNGEASTLLPSGASHEPPLWKDRRLHIALIPALIIASVALFTHFNASTNSIQSQLETPESNSPAATLQAEPSSTVTSRKLSTNTKAATDPPATNTVSPS